MKSWWSTCFSKSESDTSYKTVRLFLPLSILLGLADTFFFLPFWVCPFEPALLAFDDFFLFPHIFAFSVA